jgi:hypothetical protein
MKQFEDPSVWTIMGNRLECYYSFPEGKVNQYYPSPFYDRINRWPARYGTGAEINTGSGF